MLLAQHLSALPSLSLPCSLTIINFKFSWVYIRSTMATSWLCAAGLTVLLQLLFHPSPRVGPPVNGPLLSLLRVARHCCGSSRLIHAYSYLWHDP